MISKSVAIIISVNLFPLLIAHELTWKWKKIDVANIKFPEGFLWGCADSALQTEGIETADKKTTENSWTSYEKMVDKDGKKLHQRECLGYACERWTRYKEDIARLHELGMNAYRFQIEWSKIEPEPGVFDHNAMQHYIEVIDELKKYNIEPMVTLFHHIYPLWFDEKKGFEKRKNIPYFAEFADYVFNHLHNKVRFWIIFNEPISYAIEGYFRGHYPPCKRNLRLAGKVARNMLWAHVDIAKSLKLINPEVQIGIAHIIHPLDVYHKWNPVEHVAAKLFNHLINDLTIKFFKTGKFNWAYMMKDHNSSAPDSLDFIGINYYTHARLKQVGWFTMKNEWRPSDRIIELDRNRCKVLYPEGLYRAIKKASKLKKPIYITENGCPGEDSVLKDEFLKKHLYALSKACSKGYDVRGYFYWTLTDCFGWRRGYKPKYGIYKVDFETQKRTLRRGFNHLLETIKNHKQAYSS